MMRAREQHIAVFGESGSGKTVLLSSFYGAAQEPQYLKDSLFHVVADDPGQGNRLHKNYLGMKDRARAPETSRFSATSYAFSIKLKDGRPDSQAKRRDRFDALRLTWHDYPGEWFEANVSGPEEAQRKVDAFRSLLTSDVALLLVDGQRLLDNAGEEERYLRSLLANVRNGLLGLKEQLLENGKPLVRFPRIWVVALSKSDLLPEMDVFDFRDLVVEKAADDLEELHQVLRGFVKAPKALSVGEDFLLLSSAKFGASTIEVADRVGLDLILPVAAILPLQRHLAWLQKSELPRKVAAELLDTVGDVGKVIADLAGLVVVRIPPSLPPPVRAFITFVGPTLMRSLVKVVELSRDKVKSLNAKALAQRDYLGAVLSGFWRALDEGEEARVFLRSKR